MCVVSVGSICGECPGNIATTDKVSIRVGRNRFICMMKPDNTNGSAFVGVVCQRRGPSDKAVAVSKMGLTALGGTGMPLVQHGVNIIFRSFGLLRALAICRGITFTLRIVRRRPGGVGGRIVRALSLMNLGRGTEVLPARLSNKRRRHISVTESVMGSPGIIVTSRPAKGLSPSAS